MSSGADQGEQGGAGVQEDVAVADGVVTDAPDAENGDADAKSEESIRWDYFDEKSETGFVGLSNQGATCYMNSLLQTLYMTPEFCHALWQWEYDPEKAGPPEHCIPYQLQSLFANLKMSELAAIETTALTKSFGWDDADSFQQHDVQELCRVLFDALEREFVGTPLSNVINELWQGTLIDYIDCQACDYARERPDKYLDIPLVIRDMKSIGQSLRRFITPELLSGDNQYSCPQCEKKQDAKKGLRLADDFPYILTLQLKRFDFDYETWDRIKLNDEVSFPLFLVMDKYLDVDTALHAPDSDDEGDDGDDGDAGEASSSAAVPPADDGSSLPTSGYTITDASGGGDGGNDGDANPTMAGDGDADDDEISEADRLAIQAAIAELSAEATDPDGMGATEAEWADAEDNYDQDAYIAAVKRENAGAGGNSSGLVGAPSGPPGAGTTGGDIGDAGDGDGDGDDDDDDAVANLMGNVEVPEGKFVYELYSILIHAGSALGGHYYAYIKSFADGKWYEFNDESVSELSAGDIAKTFGGAYTSRFSGRTVSRSSNAYMLMYRRVDPERNELVVDEAAIPAAIRGEIGAVNAKYAKARAKWEAHKDDITLHIFHGDDADFEVVINRKEPMAKLKEMVLEMCGLSDTVSLANCRLRNVNMYSHIAGETYEAGDHVSLADQQISAFRSLLLETKTDDEEFEVWDPNAMVLRIYLFNQDKMGYDDPIEVSVGKDAHLFDLRRALEAATGIAPEHQRLFEMSASVCEVVEGDDNPLRQYFRIYEGEKLYLEYAETPDAPSYVAAVFEETKHFITVHFNLPGAPETDSRTNFSETIEIDRRKTLADLKAIIAERAGLPAASFRVRRGHRAAGEFKDVTKTLRGIQLHDGSNVYVERGKPTRADEFKLGVYMYRADAEEVMVKVFEISVPASILVADLKRVLASKVGLAPARMRLRERFSRRLGRVFVDDLPLGSNIQYLYDGKDIAIEPVAQDEHLQVDDLVLFVQRWFPAEFRLGRRHEVVIKNNMRQGEMPKYLSASFGIPVDRVEVVKPWSQQVNDVEQIANLRFEKLKDSDRPVSSGMWMLKAGDTILVRDADEVTEEVRRRPTNRMGGGGVGGSSGGTTREAGLHIMTHAEREAKAAEEAAKAESAAVAEAAEAADAADGDGSN